MSDYQCLITNTEKCNNEKLLLTSMEVFMASQSTTAFINKTLINRASGSCWGFGFFFFFVFLSVTNPKRPRMMSLSANDRPFLSSFRHIPPQESFVQLANLTIQTKSKAP